MQNFMKLNNPILIQTKLILGCILLLISCKTKEEKTFPKQEKITSSVYASGIIKSKEQYQVYPAVAGIIKEILVNEGDEIQQGQPIARISDMSQRLNADNATAQASFYSVEENAEKISQAKKEVELAKSKLDNETSLLERQKILWADGIGSKNDLDMRELAFKNASMQYNASKLHLNDLEKQIRFQAEQSKRTAAISSTMMGDYTIKSEVAGRLYRMTKKKGEMVNALSAIATIGNAKSFIIELEIDEFDISKIKLEQKVLLTMDSYKGEVFEAIIDKIFPLMNEKSRSFTAEAHFVKQPPNLFPNLSSEANIIIETKEKAITIPRNYLVENNFVITRKNERKKVITGLMDYEKVEIVKGLSVTDEIIKPKQ
jgi:multidrug resistance efflux pump